MILVNVKTLEEMTAVASYCKPSYYPDQDVFDVYGSNTVIFIEESPNYWSYANLKWTKKQKKYRNKKILTFREFKDKYVDVKTTAGTKLSNDNDEVNHPSHYNEYSFEVIDVIDEVVPNFPSTIAGHLQNTIKYIFRAPFKNSMKQDLEKAAWYLNHAIKLLDKE